MDLGNQNSVIIKEEWIPDHVTEETPEENPLSFRLKEEPAGHATDRSGWPPISSEGDVKSKHELHSEIGNSEPTLPSSGSSEVQAAPPVDLELENQSFDDQSNGLESSLGRSESAVSAYFCELCDYSSTHIGNFNRHVKQHDPKTKPPKAPKERLYDCELCGYKCSEFIRLKRHMMTHTGEKPLACGLCDFRSSHSNDFQRHMMVHTGEKPYACDLCDYRSSDVRNLKRHKRTHTGEKPYACDCCEYKSRTSHHMNRHKKMRHKVIIRTSATIE